jgi:hypothetical protein
VLLLIQSCILTKIAEILLANSFPLSHFLCRSTQPFPRLSSRFCLQLKTCKFVNFSATSASEFVIAAACSTSAGLYIWGQKRTLCALAIRSTIWVFFLRNGGCGAVGDGASIGIDHVISVEVNYIENAL